MPPSDLHYLTIIELAAQIRARKISPVEVTKAQLERIERLDPKLRAYATVTAEAAIKQARRSEQEISRGSYKGPLHGIPVAVKDLCYTKGVRTMAGCAVFADFMPEFDSTVVSRLAEAGAVMLGKLNMTEGAMGGYNPKLQAPENPWKESHWPGASSSGSGAATAAGLAYGTLGSDTGGSIRHPAAVCGVTGLKPTWGRVSRYGVFGLAESLDHVGPIARSAADCGIVLQAISGPDPNDPTCLDDSVPEMLGRLGMGVRGLRIGWDEEYASADMAPDFGKAVADGVRAVEKLGAKVVPVKMPGRLREYMNAWQVICTVEALSAHSAYYPSRASEYGPWFRQWLARGSAYSGVDYARAHSLRLQFNGELRLMMRDIDAFACPSTARAAYPVTPEVMYGGIPPERDPWQARYTAPYNYSGLPTIALPCGLNGQGLPLSIQFVGHPLSEPLLVQIGDAFQRATDFHRLHPPGWD